MESYIALKVTKAKTSRLSGRQRHNERIGKQGNVRIDPRKTPFNITLKKCEGTYQEAIDKIIEERYTGKKAIRKDAVRLLELTLQFGGDYGSDGKVGIVKQNEAIKKGYEFLKDRFGDENIISAIIHNDETNPHIHIDIVPMMPDGKLSAKRFLDPDGVKTLQDEFLAYMQEEIPTAGFIRKPDDALNGMEQKMFEKVADKIKEERAIFKEHINNSRAHVKFMKNKFKKEKSEFNRKAKESRDKFDKYQKDVKAELREARQTLNRDLQVFRDEKEAFAVDKYNILNIAEKVKEEKERFDKEREAFDKMIASETENLNRNKKDLERRESSLAVKLDNFAKDKADFEVEKEEFREEKEKFTREKVAFEVDKYNILNEKEEVKEEKERLNKRESDVVKRELDMNERVRTYNKFVAQYKIDKQALEDDKQKVRTDEYNILNEKTSLKTEKEEFEKQQKMVMSQIQNQLNQVQQQRQELKEFTARIDKVLENVPTFNSNLIKWAEAQPVERKKNVERLVNMAYRQGVTEPISELRQNRTEKPLRRAEKATSLPRDEMDKMLDDILSGDIEDFGKAVDLLDEDKGFYL